MSSDNVTWPLGNSLLLDCTAPLDYMDPSAPVAIEVGGGAVTATGHVLSTRVKGIQTIDAAIAATTATMATDEADRFANGEVILIEHEDGTFGRYTIDSAPAAGVFTFTPGLTVAVKAGARIWKTFGSAAATGAVYGTPIATGSKWGYVIEFPHNYDGELRRQQELEAMAIVDQAATGAHWTRAWRVIVAEPYGNP